MDYRFEHQLTGPLLSMKINPDIDFLVAWLLTQSELKYSLMIRSLLCSPLYIILISLMAFRYRRIVFTALLCWWEGFFANRLTTEVAKVISDLVSTIKNIIKPVIL